MLKAIETVYNGYRFRSRLEARWAVFFDTLGIKYEYEKEGYDLDGVWYLPDFWLPEHDMWAEIKPQPGTDPAMRKALEDAFDTMIALNKASGKDVMAIAGEPVDGKYTVSVLHHGFAYTGGHWRDARLGHGFAAISDLEMCIGVRGSAGDALLAAQQARFEHGEKPR